MLPTFPSHKKGHTLFKKHIKPPKSKYNSNTNFIKK